MFHALTGDLPPRLRQNQRASVRIVLDERDGVLALERGAQLVILSEGKRFTVEIDQPNNILITRRGQHVSDYEFRCGRPSILEASRVTVALGDIL